MITTRAQRAARFPEEYRQSFVPTAYWENGRPLLGMPPAKETYARYKALGESPDPDAVDKIARGPVTFAICSECGQNADVTATLDVNCGEFAIDLCEACCFSLAHQIHRARDET